MRSAQISASSSDLDGPLIEGQEYAAGLRSTRAGHRSLRSALSSRSPDIRADETHRLEAKFDRDTVDLHHRAGCDHALEVRASPPLPRGRSSGVLLGPSF